MLSLVITVSLLTTNCVQSLNTGDIRLFKGNQVGEDIHFGIVEVFDSATSQWGTVCDDNITPESFVVICRQLGYSYVHESYGSAVDPSIWVGHPWGLLTDAEGGTFLDDVKCVGTESKLYDCPHAGWKVENCAHVEDISVKCGKSPAVKYSDITELNERLDTLESQLDNINSGAAYQGDFRLVNVDGNQWGSVEHWGRVEVNYNGTWGTICSDGIDDQSNPGNGWYVADTICWELGYRDAVSWNRASALGYPSGSGQIWLDEVQCDGTKASLLNDCSHAVWGNTDCQHKEDFGIKCNNFRSGLETSYILSQIDKLTKSIQDTSFARSIDEEYLIENENENNNKNALWILPNMELIIILLMTNTITFIMGIYNCFIYCTKYKHVQYSKVDSPINE